MGKKGPCLHCGINSTPLWRNGPADKPVLCNACGSRFKLKGYLDDDYLPKNVQYLKNFKTGHGGTETDNLDDHDVSNDDGDHDQVPNHVPPSGTGSSTTNMPNPDDDHISSKDFGKKNPSKKRSRVGYQQMTPMEEFHKQLLDLYKSEMGGIEPSPEDDLVKDNMNNFIPSNEIGVGAILLKTHIDDDVTSTDPGSLASSSIDNPPLQSDQSSTTAPSDDH